MTLNWANSSLYFLHFSMAVLHIDNLTDRAGLLYCHVSEFYDPSNGTCGYSIVKACAELSHLGDEFRRHYGPAQEWDGLAIDRGELIHWAHSLG
jgi:hypothetical protein